MTLGLMTITKIVKILQNILYLIIYFYCVIILMTNLAGFIFSGYQMEIAIFSSGFSIDQS